MKKIDGIVPVMLTPFTEQNDVDYPGLANLIDWYLETKSMRCLPCANPVKCNS